MGPQEGIKSMSNGDYGSTDRVDPLVTSTLTEQIQSFSISPVSTSGAGQNPWVILKTSLSFVLLSCYQVTRRSFPSLLQNMCTECDPFFIFNLPWSKPPSPLRDHCSSFHPPAFCFQGPSSGASRGDGVTFCIHNLGHINPLSPPANSSPSQSCR